MTLEKERIKSRGGEEGERIFYFNTLDFWSYNTVYLHNSACMAKIQVSSFPLDSALDSFITETTGYIFSWQKKGQIPR